MIDQSKYVEMYRQAAELDTDVLWQKVSTIRDAIAAGANKDSLLVECGKESGDSRKQVAKFYAVAMVFDPMVYQHERERNYDYWIFEACATAPRVDPDDIETYSNAYYWLSEVERREIKRGKKTIHAKHTARTLKAAIRAATKPAPAKATQPETVVIYKGEALYHGYEIGSWKTELTLSILDGINTELENIDWGETVQVLITRVPASASAEAASPTAEGEAA